jgi:hypothetical protein
MLKQLKHSLKHSEIFLPIGLGFARMNRPIVTAEPVAINKDLATNV